MSAPFGFVYVFTSAAHEKDVYKIGATIHDPFERARQLSASSSAASPFSVVYKRFVAEPFQVEAALHRLFTPERLNDSREFFKVELHRVIDALDRYEEVRDLFYSGDASTPWSELFASFEDDGTARELTEDERFKCDQLRYKLDHQ